MKRAALFLLRILVVMIVLAAGAAAADDGNMVAGAGTGLFPDGAMFAGLPLTALEFGQGVLTGADGTAVGTFHAVLRGDAALGAPQVVAVEGTVNAGAVAGIATFSGVAAVDLGGGAAPGVPFEVALGPDGLQLTLDGTVLPTVAVSSGAVAIE